MPALYCLITKLLNVLLRAKKHTLSKELMIVLRRGTGTGTSEQASRCLFAPLCDDERERERIAF